MSRYKVTVASMGSMPLPGPEVFWMSAWDDWFDAVFWMVIARNDEKTVLINTGPPADLTELNKIWLSSHPSGKSQFSRLAENNPIHYLNSIGIKPEEVTDIVLTPIVAYTIGSLQLFPNANIHFSRRGWIEDVLAPPIPHHLPRNIFMPDSILKWLLFEAHERIRLINGESEVLPGIFAWESGVHHRSSLVIEINTESGVLGVTDSAFAFKNVEENINLGIGESYSEAMKTYARIRKVTDALIPLYEPEVAKRYPGGDVKW